MPKGMGYGKQPLKTPKVGSTPVKGLEINTTEGRKGSATSPHNGTHS